MWIDVTTTLPPALDRVIVAVRLPYSGLVWRTIAEYVPKEKILAEDYLDEDSDPDFSDYKNGKEYVPEGWYEYLIESECNLKIEGEVLGWMNLPPYPHC